MPDQPSQPSIEDRVEQLERDVIQITRIIANMQDSLAKTTRILDKVVKALELSLVGR